jgi:hypothetical protein
MEEERPAPPAPEDQPEGQATAPEADGWKIQRPPRMKLRPEEVVKRMQEFESKRKDGFIASVRKTKS